MRPNAVGQGQILEAEAKPEVWGEGQCYKALALRP